MIEKHTAQDFIMNTFVEQIVFGENAGAACESAAALLRRLEDRMSFFRPGSDIWLLNGTAGSGRPVPVGSDTLRVLRAALYYAERSEGAFDVTAAPLSKCWREAAARGDDRPPSEEELGRARTFVGSGVLRLFPEDGTAMLMHAHSAVDLGGIAKGYAADRAIELYRATGIKSALINLGGNVMTLGEKPDGQLWAVGLQHPDERRGVFFGALRVRGDASVVTSGGYERYVTIGAQKYHHIIDPVSGYPASSGLRSATVIARESMQADALATAAFVLGLKRAARLIAAFEDVEAVLMDDERNVWLTPGVREAWLFAPGYEHLCIRELTTAEELKTGG
jgi:thiamine biosynthesis lipoprotein